jgi:hypothetical protein
MKKLIRLVAATLLALSLTTGVASAHSISNTGPRSNNRISVRHNTRIRVNNNANVRVNNSNTQVAISGNARVSGNTNGGDAETGNASNTNSTRTMVHVSF